MESSPLFDLALQRFDDANAEDPNHELLDGKSQPHELIDAHRVHAWLVKLCPDASEALRLASRCQHIRRWEIPRDRFPRTRSGYLKWRSELKTFHAETAGEILRDIGYDEATIRRVQDLNLKKNLSSDPEGQALEDALCLAFLEFEYEAFCKDYDDEKIIRILQKTWRKMSEAGRAAAAELSLSGRPNDLLQRALGTT